MEKKVKVHMLGSFSVEMNGEKIDDTSGRMYKVWLLLAYLFYHRRRCVPQNELIRVIWEAGEENENPQSAFRTTLHRARTLLEKLEPGAGHGLIVHSNGGYGICSDVDVEMDVTRMDELYRKGCAMESAAEKAECFRQAAELYEGVFLSRLSFSQWAHSVSVYYHEKYMEMVMVVLALWEEEKKYSEAGELCRKALELEPYSEQLYYHYMKNLLAEGRKRDVISVYEKLSRLLLDEFGVLPAQEVRELYYEAVKSAEDRLLPIEQLQAQLRETGSAAGALFCEYDFFKVLHQSTARLMERTGAAAHIALITLSGKGGKTLSKKSRETAMEHLRDVIRGNLRRGDVFSRCSASQFVVLLHLANYENSCMVCDRIARSFYRQYSHSPAELTSSVRPVGADVYL